MSYPPSSYHDEARQPEDVFELTEDGLLPGTDTPGKNAAQRSKYSDGSTIDWLYEESAERQRNHILRSQHGIRGLILPLMDAARMWFVVIATGIGIGLTGAWLDVFVKWYVATRCPCHGLIEKCR